MNDYTIIGAGIVGLSVAYELSSKYPRSKISIVEKENDVAKHQTGNNSGVIHSGIYYEPGSLKAKNCILGYDLLLKFSKKYNVKHELCGKLIVATDLREINVLKKIYERGIKNGLNNLEYINSNSKIRDFEPYCSGVNAIYVPQTGIINYSEVSQKLKKILSERGVKFYFNSRINEIKGHDDFIINFNQNFIKSKKVIICCGLFSDRVSKSDNNEDKYRIVPFRGEYYKLNENAKKYVKNLIYPVPNPNFPFLGVHFTRTIGGEIEAGPNAVLSFKREGYKFNDFNFKDFYDTISWPGFWRIAAKYGKTGLYEIYRSLSKTAFTTSLQKLIPDIKNEDLVKAGSGVRAQVLSRDGNLLDDFKIQTNNHIVNILNAPSPAATSSFSIAKSIVKNL